VHKRELRNARRGVHNFGKEERKEEWFEVF